MQHVNKKPTCSLVMSDLNFVNTGEDGNKIGGCTEAGSWCVVVLEDRDDCVSKRQSYQQLLCTATDDG
jgi:hypothetical protein